MAHIKSDITEIKNSQEKVYNFLSNLDNFERLMPEQVINWKSTEDSCSFTIKGMTDLSMKISEKIPYSKINIVNGEKTQFNFNLTCQLLVREPNLTSAQIIFNAELSTMMEMLASKPLQNFVNMLASKLKGIGDRL